MKKINIIALTLLSLGIITIMTFGTPESSGCGGFEKAELQSQNELEKSTENTPAIERIPKAKLVTTINEPMNGVLCRIDGSSGEIRTCALNFFAKETQLDLLALQMNLLFNQKHLALKAVRSLNSNSDHQWSVGKKSFLGFSLSNTSMGLHPIGVITKENLILEIDFEIIKDIPMDLAKTVVLEEGLLLDPEQKRLNYQLDAESSLFLVAQK